MTSLSCIGWFSTGPKLGKFCAKKLTLGAIPYLLAKFWLCFWSHSLQHTDSSSNYMGRKRNELINTVRHIRLFFQIRIKNFKKRMICSRKTSVFVCKSSVYFSAPPLSASAPSLRLLWRRHCAQVLNLNRRNPALYTSITIGNGIDRVLSSRGEITLQKLF